MIDATVASGKGSIGNAEPAGAAAPPPQQQPAAAAAAAVQQSHEVQTENHDDDRGESGCPICRFMEAGACGEGHKVWVACRQEAKEAGVDFVQHCTEQFRSFFGCMLQNQDYYAPFLEAFHIDVDKSQEAIDRANNERQQPPPGNPQEQGSSNSSSSSSSSSRVLPTS